MSCARATCLADSRQADSEEWAPAMVGTSKTTFWQMYKRPSPRLVAGCF